MIIQGVISTQIVMIRYALVVKTEEDVRGLYLKAFLTFESVFMTLLGAFYFY